MVPFLLMLVDMVVLRLCSRLYIAPECVPSDSYRYKPSREVIGLTQLTLLTAFTALLLLLADIIVLGIRYRIYIAPECVPSEIYHNQVL